MIRTLRAAVLPLLLAAGCGSPPPPEVPTLTAAAPASAAVSAEAAPPPPAPLPAIDPSLPAGSAGLASADVSQLDAVLGEVLRRMAPDDRAAVERDVHAGKGTLADGQLARAFGLDPGRPIVAAVALTGAASVARERIVGLLKRQVTAAELRRAFEGLPGIAVVIRAVLPITSDSAPAFPALAELLEHDGWLAATEPAGYERVYFERGRAVALSRAPGALIVDAVIPAGVDHDKNGREAAVAALRSLRARGPAEAHDGPLALDGHLVRVRYSPGALAEIGLLTGVSSVLRAIAAPSIDEAQRDSLAAQGLAEAARSLELDGSPGRPYFDSVELALDGGYGALAFKAVAVPGRGADLPAAAWARADGISIPGAYAHLDVAVPWVRSWSSFVPDPMSHDLTTAVHEAGWAGLPIALPQMLVNGAWRPMNELLRHVSLQQHVDRMTIFTMSRDKPDGHVALLKPEVKPADVACALVEQGQPCDAAARLRPGATAKLGERRYARLVQVKGRWAVVVSRDKDVVEKTKLELVPAAPGRIQLPGGAEWARELRGLPAGALPGGFVGEVRLEGNKLVAELRPAPAAPAKAR